MHRRRGFTLVELLIVMVVLVLVGAALTRILVTSMRVSQAQLVQADMQTNVRTGTLVLPLEFREIGYDSNIYVVAGNPITSDIESIATTSIQFLAGRGFSTTCFISPALDEWRIRKPVYGMREPLATDSIHVYVENDENTGIDDQWVALDVTNIDPNGLCGADPAIVLTTNGDITVGPEAGEKLTTASVFVGGPVRWSERMNYGRWVDAADGLVYVGARSVSAGEAVYRAVAGPLDPATGFRLRYFDKNLVMLDPAVADPADVRTIDLRLIGQTRQPVSLGGGSQRNTRNYTVRTRVALRNTLKH